MGSQDFTMGSRWVVKISQWVVDG